MLKLRLLEIIVSVCFHEMRILPHMQSADLCGKVGRVELKAVNCQEKDILNYFNCCRVTLVGR